MHKYIICFSKYGVLCYISHLDLMRFFKRAFKRAGVKLMYSQGFNPHPKMGFAQPLSLGYTGLNEYIEFETEKDFEPEELLGIMREQMPEGLELKSCKKTNETKKTLASMTCAATYIISIPVGSQMISVSADEYMNQATIKTLKRQKKKKEPVEVDIKPMIREIDFTVREETLFINATLDSGSNSNLSPELLINNVLEYLEIKADKSEIEVTRTEIIFQNL